MKTSHLKLFDVIRLEKSYYNLRAFIEFVYLLSEHLMDCGAKY